MTQNYSKHLFIEGAGVRNDVKLSKLDSPTKLSPPRTIMSTTETTNASDDAIGSAGTVPTTQVMLDEASADFANASGGELAPTTIELPRRQFLTFAEPTDEVRKFFARPTYGGTLTWSTTALTQTSTDVCTSYFALTDVQSRLVGHHHIRGTLVVTIKTTTSPHHVGRTQFALVPVAPTQLVGALVNSVSMFSCDNALVVDASTANPITLRLPFSCPTDWLNLYSGDKRLGLLYMSTLCPIKRDDGGTVGPPKFTYFVSIEDVEVGALTPYAASAKAERVKKWTNMANEDHIMEGPVSGPMKTVKFIADTVSDIPGVGWIASGVSTIATAIGSAAELLGFSRPTEPIKLVYTNSQAKAGDLTHANMIDESIKLTLMTDAQQPISAEGLGGKVDSLSWKNVIERWGLINVETWLYASTAGTRIAFYAVTPDLCKLNTGSKYYTTPMSYIAAFFQAWTGSIKFRITVAATPYIKGQLLVVYTPNASTTTALTISQAMSSAQYCVLDLNQEMDKVFEVGWSSNMKYLVCGDPAVKDTQYDRANGYLHIYVLDPLVSSASVDLNIVVSVMPGKGFMFLQPTDYGVVDYTVSSRIVSNPSAAEVEADSKYLEEAKAPKQPTGKERDREEDVKPYQPPNSYVASSMEQPYLLRDPNEVPTNLCSFGYTSNDDAFHAFTNLDAPRSARVWLKRYYKTFEWSNLKTFGAAADSVMTMDLQFPHVPQLQISQTAYQSTTAGGMANPTRRPFTPLSALLTMFVGYVGAVRHKVVVTTPSYNSTTVARDRELSVSASLDIQPGFTETFNHSSSTVVYPPGNVGVGVSAAITTPLLDQMVDRIRNVGNAAALATTRDQAAVVSVELPFVSPFRYGNQGATTYSESRGLRLTIVTKYPASATDGGPSQINAISAVDYLSIGEDFNLFFFLCTPSVDTSTLFGNFTCIYGDFPTA
jgi:hypothetical protein